MKTLHHVAIAVSDLDAAEATFRDLLNLPWRGRENVPDQKVITSIFDIGESRVELVSPASEDSPIAGFLAKKGSGLHHIAFEVEDIEAEMARLKRAGIRLLGEAPSRGAGGARIVFLHPKAIAGVLIELVEKA